jgi:hypothetical protein
MMKNYTMGIFTNLAPDLEDEDKYIILPCYNEKHSHWCFIIVDINRKGEDHKVYMVDSVTTFQKQHIRDISKTENSWCSIVKKWIELEFDGPNK